MDGNKPGKIRGSFQPDPLVDPGCFIYHFTIEAVLSKVSSIRIAMIIFSKDLLTIHPCVTPDANSENVSGQITIIPKPELRAFWGDSLTKPPDVYKLGCLKNSVRLPTLEK